MIVGNKEIDIVRQTFSNYDLDVQTNEDVKIIGKLYNTSTIIKIFNNNYLSAEAISRSRL
ncbi:hypothetical protein YBT020_04130 [Bacillus thuringiensis serovar finitimus YBT-020]|nr:hypothetical protein YBT020_04130 [Bacillus thuringiensis serovar finitimus YBT-020]